MPYVAYYGDRDEEQMDAPTKSYDRCHKFATATALGNNFKYTLAMTSARKSYAVVDLVRDLVLKPQEHVIIGSSTPTASSVRWVPWVNSNKWA